METVDFLDQSVHLEGRESEEEMESRVTQAIQDLLVLGDHQVHQLFVQAVFHYLLRKSTQRKMAMLQ